MLYFDASSNTTYAVDAREVAIQDDPDHVVSCIALPSEIEGYREIHHRWGKLPWKDLFGPAIRYATNGFPVSPALARAIRIWYAVLKQNNFNSLVEQLTNPETDLPYNEGENMKWPRLAKTFQILAEENFEKYYSDVIADLTDLLCTVSVEDFEKYQVRVTKPLHFAIPNRANNNQVFTVLSHPPPSGGCIVSLILNLLSAAQSKREQSSKPQEMDSRVNFFHQYIECAKLAYPAFEFNGDYDFHKEVTQAVKNMTNPITGEKCADLINQDRCSTDFQKSYSFLNSLIDPLNISGYSKLGSNIDLGGTAHASVVSPHGDAVSITSSINNYFGSKTIGPRTGIIFNNTMEDFAYKDRERFRLAVSNVPERHLVKRGSRPVSAMSPIMVLSSTKNFEIPQNDLGLKFPKDSEVHLLCGGAGGSRIVGAVSFVLAQALLAPEPVPLSHAIQAPRIRHWIHNSGSSLLVLEDGFCSALKKHLENMGHTIEQESERYLTVISGIQKVQKSGGKWLACCDARKGGCPAGI